MAGGPGWQRSDRSSLGLARDSWRAANLSPPRALGSVPPAQPRVLPRFYSRVGTGTQRLVPLGRLLALPHGSWLQGRT